MNILMKLFNFGPIRSIIEFLQAYGEDHVTQLSAAFSYYALFAIGPMLLIIASLGSIIFGPEAVNGQLAQRLTDQFGTSVAQTIQDVVANTYKANYSAIGIAIGAFILILTASGLFSHLRGSLNQIFGVVGDPKAPRLHGFFWPRIKGIVLLGLASIFVVGTTAGSVVITSIMNSATANHGSLHWLLESINFIASVLIIGLLVGLIYISVPDLKIPRKLALASGLIVALLFGIGKTALGILIGDSKTVSAYGAAASFIALLLWVFYFGQLLFAGAVGIKLYTRHRNIELKTNRYHLRQRKPI